MPTVTEICKLYGKIKPSKMPNTWATINGILIEDGSVNIVCNLNSILTEILRAARNVYMIPTELRIVMKKSHVTLLPCHKKTIYVNCTGTFKKTVHIVDSRFIIHEGETVGN